MDPLRREVLAPRRPAGLLGPLFVLGSTLTLAMAMATMALAPHARHHGRYYRPAMQHHVTPHELGRLRAEPRGYGSELDARNCQRPVYHANADGTVDATFEVCADRPSRR